MKRMLFVSLVAMIMLNASLAAAQTTRLRYSGALYVDNQGSGLNRPEGIACNADNLVAVSDTGYGQILKYSYQQGMFKFEGQVKIPELTRPGKVLLNSKNELYVLDEKAFRIVKIDPAGAFAGFVQPAGVPAPETLVLRSFALDKKDNLYLLDIASGRVIVLDSSGTFVRQIAYPGEYGFFADLVVASEGSVLALDSVEARVYAAAPNAPSFSGYSGALREYLRFPGALALDNEGLIFVTDRNGGAMVVLNQAGALLGTHLGMGWKDGLLRYPSQACINGQGTLFIADRENNRVQVFTVSK